jgi:hypothetical protein
LTSFLTIYVNERNQSRRDFLNKQFAQRETLYSDFINEAARLFADSREHHFERIDTLVPIYALLNRIRLNGSEEVVRAAQKTIENIITSYDHPNLTIEELHNLPSNGSDPLREFGEACRKELIRSIGLEANTINSTTESTAKPVGSGLSIRVDSESQVPQLCARYLFGVESRWGTAH